MKNNKLLFGFLIAAFSILILYYIGKLIFNYNLIRMRSNFSFKRQSIFTTESTLFSKYNVCGFLSVYNNFIIYHVLKCAFFKLKKIHFVESIFSNTLSKPDNCHSKYKPIGVVFQLAVRASISAIFSLLIIDLSQTLKSKNRTFNIFPEFITSSNAALKIITAIVCFFAFAFVLNNLIDLKNIIGMKRIKPYFDYFNNTTVKEKNIAYKKLYTDNEIYMYTKDEKNKEVFRIFDENLSVQEKEEIFSELTLQQQFDIQNDHRNSPEDYLNQIEEIAFNAITDGVKILYDKCTGKTNLIN
jgi:hypothetical protein